MSKTKKRRTSSYTVLEIHTLPGEAADWMRLVVLTVSPITVQLPPITRNMASPACTPTRSAKLKPRSLVELLRFDLHGSPGAHGIAGSRWIRIRPAKNSHNCVAQEFINNPAVFLHHLTQALQQITHDMGDFVRRAVFGKGRKTGQISKYNVDIADFTAWGAGWYPASRVAHPSALRRRRKNAAYQPVHPAILCYNESSA